MNRSMRHLAGITAATLLLLLPRPAWAGCAPCSEGGCRLGEVCEYSESWRAYCCVLAPDAGVWDGAWDSGGATDLGLGDDAAPPSCRTPCGEGGDCRLYGDGLSCDPEVGCCTMPGSDPGADGGMGADRGREGGDAWTPGLGNGRGTAGSSRNARDQCSCDASSTSSAPTGGLWLLGLFGLRRLRSKGA